MPRGLDAQPWAGALAAVDRILNREPEADEVLRQTVAAIAEQVGDYTWVGLSFVEEDGLARGPQRGNAGSGPHELEVPVSYDGRQIGALGVRSTRTLRQTDRSFLDRVALLVSAHCLVGWDTGGIDWDDLG